MSDNQRTEEWYNERAGRFTSSEIYKLMGIKGLGEMGKTYAFEKAIEIFAGRNTEDGFVSFDMQRGIELEPLAFEKLSVLMAVNFIPVTKCGFIPLGKNTGGSPDGLFGNDGVFDIKCPKPENFFRLVVTNEIDDKYFHQLQHQMYVTGRSKAISFQYCIYNGEEYWHSIEVPRCEITIDKMKLRIDEATIIRDDFVNELINKNQWKQLKSKELLLN